MSVLSASDHKYGGEILVFGPEKEDEDCMRSLVIYNLSNISEVNKSRRMRRKRYEEHTGKRKIQHFL